MRLRLISRRRKPKLSRPISREAEISSSSPDMKVNVGASMPNLSSVCEMMGMKSEDGLVLEGSQSNYYNNPLYLYPIIGSNGPTSPVSLLDSSNIGVLMPYSHGISAIEGAEGVTVTPVLSTTTSAYLKKTVDCRIPRWRRLTAMSKDSLWSPRHRPIPTMRKTPTADVWSGTRASP